MTRKREGRVLKRQHLWLYEDNVEKLNYYFGDTVGISAVVREVIDKYLASVEAKAEEKLERERLRHDK